MSSAPTRLLLMRRSLRQNALAFAFIGLAFCAFFQASKHSPRLSAVNPFTDDPYDSVGSFAVQFVLFMVLVSLFRAFRRPTPDAEDAAIQVRGLLIAYIAAAFALVADLIAMLRHQPMWIASRAGDQLLALTGCLLLWTIAGSALLLFTTRILRLSPFHTIRTKIAVFPAAVFILFFYPEGLRQSLAGEIFTVLCGLALLFLVVRSIGTAFDSNAGQPRQLDPGVLEKPHLRKLRGKTAGVTGLLNGWLRSPRHRWIFVVAAGIFIGAFLVTQELAEGGPSPHGSKRLLVIAVYLGLETAGIFTGYALLAEPLSLFPPERP